MRLSEAIALGRVLLKPRAYMRESEDGLYGCAIGMAVRAHGHSANMFDLSRLWPWIDTARFSEPPCGCGIGQKRLNAHIAHLFDQHVMGEKDWTLDRLIDWVRSVEPTEATPSTSNAVAANEARPELVGEKI